MVEIPTNQPMVRLDQNDQIFKTKDGKWKAVLDEIVGRHEKGQPVLVGTVSVEVSEMISEALKRDGIKHAVLNAKPEHAEREGELIAQAGRKGAVMIATNMAGRGVDIKLGGDPEHLAIHELKKQGITHESEGYEEALARRRPSWSRSARPRPRKCASSAASSSAAPSATSRAGSTTSCAAAPAARATPASRASSSPPKTT